MFYPSFVELRLHRRITRVPHTDGAVYYVSTQMEFELRDVCEGCHEVLLWANEGWQDSLTVVPNL